ncbi:MAG: tetratricopeptide repeat protein [Planctomycetota bacterium]|jgi:tetratricopeptide (TPR) repeat protein
MGNFAGIRVEERTLIVRDRTRSPARRGLARTWLLALVPIVAILAGWFGLRFWVEHSARNLIYVSFQPARAADLLERWNPWLGSPTSLRWLLAEAHRKVGDRGRVRRITDALAAEGVESVRAAAPFLLLEAAAGTPQRVKEKIGPLLQIYKKQGAEVLASMVQGYFTQGDSTSANQTLRLWAELYDDDFQLEFWQGVLATQNYNLEKALPAFQRSIELNPDFPRARQELAEVYIEQAKFEEAKSGYQWLHEHYPDNNEYITGYARCLLNLGYPEQAVEQLNKLRDVSGLPSPELALVCETNLEAGRVEEASRQADILLKRWPEALPYLQLQARCKAKLGEQSASEKLFAKAAESQTKRPEVDRLLEQLSIDAGNHALRMNLGELMMTFLDPAGGVGYIQVASRTVPNDIRAHQMLAAYYEREGKLAIAEIHRRAVQRIELAIEEAALMQQGGLGMEPPPAPSNPP